MLNVFDLLVLLFDVVVVFFLFCGSHPICGRNTPYFKVTLFLFGVSIDSTAFATCLLIVTRTISICYPFYQINKKAVQISALVFLVQEILRLLLKLYAYFINTSRSVLSFCSEFDNSLMIVLLSIVILVSLVSLISSAWKLLNNQFQIGVAQNNEDNQSPRTNRNQKAVITILMVTILFCVLNSFFCIAAFLFVYHHGDTNKMSTLLPLYQFSLWIALPLNSAINPIIYFIRRKDMREYIKDLLPSFL